jgi:hypothetical protein
MRNALALFDSNLSAARNLEALYSFLSANVTAPMPYDDLLRSQVVYAVSAFDKLIHDLVRTGMVQIFSGARPPTAKYLSEPIRKSSLALYPLRPPPSMSSAIAHRLEAVLTDPDTRMARLSVFADSMHHIRAQKPDWCLVRFHGRHLRLFAGSDSPIDFRGRACRTRRGASPLLPCATRTQSTKTGIRKGERRSILRRMGSPVSLPRKSPRPGSRI